MLSEVSHYAVDERGMTKKILITYATRTGTTAGVAEEIGKILAKNGADVEVRRMQDVQDLRGDLIYLLYLSLYLLTARRRSWKK